MVIIYFIHFHQIKTTWDHAANLQLVRISHSEVRWEKMNSDVEIVFNTQLDFAEIECS